MHTPLYSGYFILFSTQHLFMLKLLRKYSEENNTILCFGIDPRFEDIIPIHPIARVQSPEERIMNYYFEITDKLLEENQIAAIKPNYAYFAQYGFLGMSALKNIIQRYKNKTLIILDAKRGDIGKSSEAYATELYDFWGADGSTVSPYMGADSVKPFLRKNKLTYMLCRTSNKGAKDFEELSCNGKKLYEYVAEKSLEWGCGLVVGATSDSIKKIVSITKNKVPLLIPGVGSQGGDLKMVLESIKDNLSIHRINSSSGISYAYKKSKKYSDQPVEAALEECNKLNKKIREYL
uniref:Orotidine-5'-phosphate decarboxylase n=1 Tax=uncultured marine group II/III euryarchaeote KM3_195_B08 TaxID=1457970 RepID=A0A075GUW5_9EURY|nr:orotidine 5'-phosphate decarboxylase (pyrF) [uncultured marine group II/III euryarchaeote KM3_195_B08]